MNQANPRQDMNRMRRKPNNKPNHHRRSGGGSNGHHSNNGGGNGRFRTENNSAKMKAVSANRDKYLNLARDAMSSGDRVEAENFLQHAEHYYRVLAVLQEEDARYRAERQQEQQANFVEGGDNNAQDFGSDDDSDDAVSTANSAAPQSSAQQSSSSDSSEPRAQVLMAEAC